MAPEVIQQAGYDFKADIWSLGITAMEMVNGEPPNASTHPMKVLFLIPKAPAPRLEGNRYSRDLRDFVAACLIKDSDRRPTARDLLQHNFIRGAGKVEILQELVQRHQTRDFSTERNEHLKYYEETLNTMTTSAEGDDWIFDTVKASTQNAPLKLAQQRSSLSIDAQPNTAKLKNDFVEADPPMRTSPRSSVLHPTMKRPAASENSASIHPKKFGSQKKPLAPSTNFGNSASTVRQFQRLSDASSEGSSGTQTKLQDENRLASVEAVTKEGLLGRRAYANVIDQAVQETCAQTANISRREAIARVGQAWSDLDQADPEGQYHLLKLIIEKAQRFDVLSIQSVYSKLIRHVATQNCHSSWPLHLTHHRNRDWS